MESNFDSRVSHSTEQSDCDDSVKQIYPSNSNERLMTKPTSYLPDSQLVGPETIQMELLLRVADLQTKLSSLELDCSKGKRVTISESDFIALQLDYETLNNLYDLARQYYWSNYQQNTKSLNDVSVKSNRTKGW